MVMSASISPLRIADEAFLVASSIERCPKTMMLRELVQNALEAAARGASGSVRIKGVAEEGVRKLAIWNTGPGLSRAELLRVTDLSSSLNKTVALDGNFGMGAKVASLASNREGLRYRSCKNGRVSQVVLGERGGVFGRLLQAGAEARDVTAECHARGDYDLAEDWTEVLLMGNRPDQDTARAPYDGDPVVDLDWIARVLGRRYFAIPENVTLTIEKSAGGAPVDMAFVSSFDSVFFDRMESVATDDCVVLHYGYRSQESTRPQPPSPSIGLGVIVHRKEIYGVIDAYRWALEAPSYGFTFAARQCVVLIELPDDYPVIPDIYRQYLQYRQGDQQQAQVAHFGELVAANIPGWMRRIIASMMPGADDALAHIRDDLSHLLKELGVFEAPRKGDDANNKKQSEEPVRSGEAAQPRTPKLWLPKPPEILLLDDEQSVVEKGLAGRAARYYPTPRQLFVNLRYSAFLQMSARLQTEFSSVADAEAVRLMAKQATEWTLVSRLGRALVFGLAKKRADWREEEITRITSPESLCLAVDDLDASMPAARARMAAYFGLSAPAAPASDDFGGRANAAQRLAGELADAEARLQQSIVAGWPQGQFLRRLASIEMRRRNHSAALAWLRRAMENDPEAVWPYIDMSRTLQASEDLDGAIEVCEQAIVLTGGAAAAPLSRRGELEVARGALDTARDYFERAVTVDPQDFWAQLALSNYLLMSGDMGGAQAAAERAVELAPQNNGAALLRMSEIEKRKGDLERSRLWLDRALEANPNDPASNMALAEHLRQEGDLEAADAALACALAGKPINTAPIYRRRAELASLQGRRAEALALLEQAVDANPYDAGALLDLSRALMEQGDDENARICAEKALPLNTANPAPALLRLADIASRAGRLEEALHYRERAVAEAPNDIWAPAALARQLLTAGDFDRAEEVLMQALSRLQQNHAAMLTLLAEIQIKRGDDTRALACIDAAIAAEPRHCLAWVLRSHISSRNGDFDLAEEAAKEALRCKPANPGPMLRRLGEINMRRGDSDAAVVWSELAVKADPNDPWSRLLLSEALVARGDLETAALVSEEALSFEKNA